MQICIHLSGRDRLNHYWRNDTFVFVNFDVPSYEGWVSTLRQILPHIYHNHVSFPSCGLKLSDFLVHTHSYIEAHNMSNCWTHLFLLFLFLLCFPESFWSLIFGLQWFDPLINSFYFNFVVDLFFLHVFYFIFYFNHAFP